VVGKLFPGTFSNQPAGAPGCQAWSNTETTKTEIPFFLNLGFFFLSSSFSLSVLSCSLCVSPPSLPVDFFGSAFFSFSFFFSFFPLSKYLPCSLFVSPSFPPLIYLFFFFFLSFFSLFPS
jgi:hypothetical protein